MAADVYDVHTERTYHHGDLKRALVEAAFDLLQVYGLDRLSLRSVARRAGVSAMAPYRHFPDRKALLGAVAEHGVELLARRLEGAGGDPDPGRAIVDQGLAYVAFAARYPDLFRLMYAREPGRSGRADPKLSHDPSTPFGLLARTVSAVVAPADAETAALAAWSFIHGLASLVVDRRLTPFPQDSDELVRRLLGFFAGRLAGPA